MGYLAVAISSSRGTWLNITKDKHVYSWTIVLNPVIFQTCRIVRSPGLRILPMNVDPMLLLSQTVTMVHIFCSNKNVTKLGKNIIVIKQDHYLLK